MPNTVAGGNDLNGVLGVANNAQSTANTAQSTASTAQSTANNAQSTANSASSTANSAYSLATNAFYANGTTNLIGKAPTWYACCSPMNIQKQDVTIKEVGGLSTSHFDANNGACRTNAGLWGTEWYNYSGAAGSNLTAHGNLSVTGTKPFVMVDPADSTKTIRYYALEAPSILLMDAGEGSLISGQATISLHSTFSRVTDPAVVLRVVVTPNGDCNGIFVQNAAADRSSFTVKECQNGTSNTGFNWIAWAVRVGYANQPVVESRPADYLQPDMTVSASELVLDEDPVLIAE